MEYKQLIAKSMMEIGINIVPSGPVLPSLRPFLAD